MVIVGAANCSEAEKYFSTSLAFGNPLTRCSDEDRLLVRLVALHDLV